MVDSSVYKTYLLKYLFPAIKQTWPRKDRRTLILVQQDNAKPHVSPFDPDILEAGVTDKWNIRLTFQPANSPDLNVLDLGLFSSLQSLQYQRKMKGIEDIVYAVHDAFKVLTCQTLDNVFLTLQNCMAALLGVGGGNAYTIPHMGKDKLRRVDLLPSCIQCDRKTYDDAKKLLHESGRTSALFFPW